MLKIKDEIELKELEKFGFDDEMSPIYSYFGNYGAVIYTIKVYKDTRLIDFYVSTDDDVYFELANECYDKIFDLIQAGLVEKV